MISEFKRKRHLQNEIEDKQKKMEKKKRKLIGFSCGRTNGARVHGRM